MESIHYSCKYGSQDPHWAAHSGLELQPLELQCSVLDDADTHRHINKLTNKSKRKCHRVRTWKLVREHALFRISRERAF